MTRSIRICSREGDPIIVTTYQQPISFRFLSLSLSLSLSLCLSVYLFRMNGVESSEDSFSRGKIIDRNRIRGQTGVKEARYITISWNNVGEWKETRNHRPDESFDPNSQAFRERFVLQISRPVADVYRVLITYYVLSGSRGRKFFKEPASLQEVALPCRFTFEGS